MGRRRAKPYNPPERRSGIPLSRAIGNDDLPDAPFDERAQYVDGRLDSEPEVAELTLGDRVADPLQRVEEHGVLFARPARACGAEPGDEGQLATSLASVEGPRPQVLG